jgi:hypothetical protein
MEIVKITWHQVPPPGQFQVVFEDGRQEAVPGDRPKRKPWLRILGLSS